VRSPLLLVLSFCGLCLLVACGGGGLRILPPPLAPLVITSGPPPAGTTGSAYAGGSGFSLTAAGGLAPYVWRWAAAANSSLPPGLTLSNSSISGTPTTRGSYNVIVTVADSESPPVQKSVSYPINIDTSSPSLEITSSVPPSGTVGLNYGSSFNCLWSPVLGWHLACISCDPSVAGSCPSTPCPTPIGSPKHCFEFAGFSFTATGGVVPYIWRASGMPPGLTLDPSSGEVNGIPTSAGSYYVSVMLSDSESPPAQATANYTIDIGGSSVAANAFDPVR